MVTANSAAYITWINETVITQTHRDNEGSVTGVLLHPAAHRLRRRRYRIPVTERLIVPVCKPPGGSAVALTLCVN